MKLRLPIIVYVLFLLILPVFVTQVESGTSTNRLYAHAETTTIGGVSYYLYKLSSADGPATTLSQSAATTGRKLMGRWVYPLSGIVSILASTWTVTYRAMKSSSATSVVAHGDIDILIRKSDNTIRATIATNVANSPSLTLVNIWQTLIGTYNWPGYTVVDQTDYLEVAYYTEVTTPQSSKSVRLLVDDGALALVDQTKIENVIFTYPNQAPVASFTFSPSNPLIYEAVTFDASVSYDSDGSIVSYTWDFGDGNITTVTSPIVTHVYSFAKSTVNYTVTLTATDNEGSTGLASQIVPVTNPAVLNVSLPTGTYAGPHDDHWLAQCWLLNVTELSATFKIRIDDVHPSITSNDTHLVIALNNSAYQYLDGLTVDSTSIPTSSFTSGTPQPYGFTLTWEEDVYPTWYSDIYVVGLIGPKGFKEVEVSVTFSNIANVAMHFDAYGCTEAPPPKCVGQITHNPHEKDSTVLFSPPPSVKYYLTVETDPEGIVAIPGEGLYDNCTYVDLTAPLFVPGESGVGGQRYSFCSWTVDGNFVTGNPITVHMDANHTAVAHYVLQYYLTVTSPYGTSGGQGWYNAGTTAFATVTPLTVPGTAGVQYVFTHWSGDASGTTSPSEPIVMSGPKNATANWKTQYLITVRTNGLGTKITNIYNGTTILGTATDATPFTGWFDQDALIRLDVDSPIYGSPTRYEFTQWTGDASGSSRPFSVTMNSPKDITANYKTQYEVTFTHTGLDSSATGTVVTVNNSAKTFSELPYSFWVDSGTVVTYSYSTMVSSSTLGKRFVLTDVTGPTPPITVTNSVTVTGNYKVQYLLTVRTSGLGTHTTNVYNDTDVLGTATDATPYMDWFDEGSLILLDIDSPITEGSKRFMFTQWSGDATGTIRPASVTMSTTKDITANYKTQYEITVTASPVEALGGTFKVMYTQCGTVYIDIEKITPWTEWVDASTTVTVSQPQDIINTRYKFDRYDPSQSVIMDNAKTITLVYKQIPPLSVSISPTTASIKIEESVSFTSTVSGGEPSYYYQWYLNGSAVSGANSASWTFTPTSLQPIGNYTVYLIVRDKLGNTAKSNEASVTVAPKLTVSISPTEAAIEVGQSVQFTSTVSGGYPSYSYQWYLNGNPVSGAMSSGWTFTPAAGGVYYVYLKVTDGNNNTADSPTARILAGPAVAVPVGGYSVSLVERTPMSHVATCVALIVMFGVALSLIRRKTK